MAFTVVIFILKEMKSVFVLLCTARGRFLEFDQLITGVNQGDPPSATLFSIAMDCILKKMELRGYISTRLRQCTAYADDILITSRTTQTMIDTFVKLKNESLKYGLTVNVHKTKYLKCSRRQDQLKAFFRFFL